MERGPPRERIKMPAGTFPNPMMQPPSNNNWWFGNNYSSGYSQASRSPFSSQQPAMGMMPPMQGYGMPSNAPQPVQTDAQTINNVLQVMGPESAADFRVGPNSKVILMDSNRDVIYTKRSDDTGHAETRAFAIHEIPLFPEKAQAEPQQMANYATKDDIAEIKAMMAAHQKSIEELVVNNA